MVDQAQQAIVAFRDAFAQRDVQLLVVIAPNKETVYPDMLSTQASELETFCNPQTSLLCERLHAAGVEVVDLSGIFCFHREAIAPEKAQDLYLAQDSHWSPAGVELAARVIAERIEILEWVTPGHTKYARQSVTTERLGDLVRMLQVPQLEHTIPAERIVCRQVVDADGKLIRLDDPNAEVLVLGDSFLRIYEQDEPGSAGFTSQLAYELRRPVAGLINDGGGTTLVVRNSIDALHCWQQTRCGVGIRRTRHPFRHRGLASCTVAAGRSPQLNDSLLRPDIENPPISPSGRPSPRSPARGFPPNHRRPRRRWPACSARPNPARSRECARPVDLPSRRSTGFLQPKPAVRAALVVAQFRFFAAGGPFEDQDTIVGGHAHLLHAVTIDVKDNVERT